MMKKIRENTNHKKAFTMLELIFVIVVLGILASLALPRMERDLRQEAADNILSAVQYTQHLALLDNKHRASEANWQKSFWTIFFQENGQYYTISSNMDYQTSVDKNETATDPSNGKLIFSDDATIDNDESPNIFLYHNYGIDTVNFTNCQTTSNGNNASRHVAFDYRGRPHKGMYNTATNDYSTMMTANCVIVFSFEDTSIANITLTIQRETGYASIN